MIGRLSLLAAAMPSSLVHGCLLANFALRLQIIVLIFFVSIHWHKIVLNHVFNHFLFIFRFIDCLGLIMNLNYIVCIVIILTPSLLRLNVQVMNLLILMLDIVQENLCNPVHVVFK